MTQHRPSRKQKGARPGYTPGYQKDLAKTRTRIERRSITNPGVRLQQDAEGSGFTWGPVFKGDDDYWWMKIAEAFGTRSDSVCATFMDQLIELSDGQCPNQTLVNAALAIIGSHKPRTESEAMLAAQMVAVHALTMKAAAYSNMHGRWHIPERETKLVFRGARTFAEQIDTMARLKGGKRMQEINVHYFDHRQIVEGDVHVHRGEQDFGRPTRGANDGHGKSADALPAGEHACGAALWSEDPERLALPGAEGEGTSPVPGSRLWAWIRRAAR